MLNPALLIAHKKDITRKTREISYSEEISTFSWREIRRHEESLFRFSFQDGVLEIERSSCHYKFPNLQGSCTCDSKIGVRKETGNIFWGNFGVWSRGEECIIRLECVYFYCKDSLFFFFNLLALRLFFFISLRRAVCGLVFT